MPHPSDDPRVAPVAELGTRLIQRARQLGMRVGVMPERQAEKLVKRIAPEYPLQARQWRIEGTVVLVVVVGKDGRVASVRTLKGHWLLAQAAEAAVRRWIYEPTLEYGEAVEVNTWVEVPFRL